MAKIDLDQMISRLASRDFTEQDLRGFLDGAHVSDLLTWGDVFPVGIVAPDAVRGRSQLNAAELGNVFSRLAGSDVVRSWRVFPIGIVAPDQFSIEVDIGKRVGGG